MRRTIHLAGIGFAVIVLASAAVFAEVRKEAYELGVYGGIENGDNNLNVASNHAFGLRFGYAISAKIMAELNVDMFDTNREITGFAGDPSQPATQRPFAVDAPTQFTSFTAALTANFLTEREVNTKPFLTVGLGIVSEERDGTNECVDLNPAQTDPTRCSDVFPNGSSKDPTNPMIQPNSVSWQQFLPEKDTGTALTLGFGARTYFGPWFGLRYEARYFHHDSFNANQDAFQLSVGATFVLGGSK